jgi:diguanylate cyclase (GGDEF)-like protein/PAS domain S-box-containing protein
MSQLNNQKFQYSGHKTGEDVQLLDKADMAGRALLYEQLTKNASVTRASVAGNLFNAFVTIFVALYYEMSSALIALAVCALVSLVIGWRLSLAHKINKATPDDPALESYATQVTLVAAMLGTCWGMITCWMFAYGSQQVQVYGAIIGAGMMSAGGVAFRTRKIAAITYVMACGLCSAVGLLLLGYAAAYAALGLLVCYLAVLCANIHASAIQFDADFRRQQKIASASETIKLLLNDFAEQGTEWIIEIAADGRFRNVSDRFAAACRKSADLLDGMTVSDLFEETPERDDFISHLQAGMAVRRHTLSLMIEGERFWWSLSARPVKDGVIAYRGIATDISAQKRAEGRVSHLALHDGLTDLPNRIQFHEKLQRYLGTEKNTAAVMYLDLDRFKIINDTLGHPVGDRLLKEVARRLKDNAGDDHLVARFGGDEFCVLVPATGLAEIQELACAILADLSRPIALGDHDVTVGVSIGIAYAPEDAATVDELIRKADLALYAAKAEGRSTVRYFKPDMDETARLRRDIEQDLRCALRQQEMVLHYQPIVAVAAGVTTSYEALIRWEHPVRGVVMPGVFIPIAEETGLILTIGEWVIRKALDDMRHWPDHVGVSINLSPAQMRSPTLISTVVHALASSAVDPARVCLEITESVLMQDSAANIETLHKLRSLGVQIALDDFGTGYSSLTYLRSFPFSKIKIDRSFVHDLDDTDDSRAIIRSVITLASSLGMTTTAEGVETDAQLAILSDEGCTEVQGFLFSKAVPQEQLTDLRGTADSVTPVSALPRSDRQIQPQRDQQSAA